MNFFSQISQWLKNRLLLTDLLTRHPPEIHDVELVPPVVIAGLPPRTGTTHLHNLLAAGPTFRTMQYWESVEPFPLPSEAGMEPDPRRARMDLAVSMMDLLMPHFRSMHEMTTDHVHEEIQLLANDFSTMLMETLAHVPSWRDYYLGHDQTPPHYEYLATQLKAMQFLRGRQALAAEVPPAAPRTTAGARSRLSRARRRLHPPRPPRPPRDLVDAGHGGVFVAHVQRFSAGARDRHPG